MRTYKCGDTEQLAGVVHSVLLEDLGGNGHSRVHGVGDDAEGSLRAVLGAGLASGGESRNHKRVLLPYQQRLQV